MFRKNRTLSILFGLVMTYTVFLYRESVPNGRGDSAYIPMHFENESEDPAPLSHNDACSAKDNVLLLKTHKTGSSTIQNILLRYADVHKLKLALPQPHNYFGHPELFSRRMVNSSKTRFKHKNALSPIENNIFAFHARFNYKEMKAVMPPDTIFITVLREPVSLMESLIAYYNFPVVYNMTNLIVFMDTFFSANPNASVHHAIRTERFKKKYGRNQMSFDLGMDENSFDDIDNVTDFIGALDAQFDLVMIAERMDESLILLQHLLCWSLDDILAFRQNARLNTSVDELSSDLKERMRYFNKADQLLYDYFSVKLDHQIEEFGEEAMKKQVAVLRDATHSMYEECVGQIVSKNLNFAPTYVKNKVNVLRYRRKGATNRTCELLTIAELEYLSRLRKRREENPNIKAPSPKKKSSIISANDLKRLLLLE